MHRYQLPLGPVSKSVEGPDNLILEKCLRPAIAEGLDHRRLYRIPVYGPA
jgi:hypothetical protein